MVWRVVKFSAREKFVLSTLDQIYMEKILEYLKAKKKANLKDLGEYITGKDNYKIGGGTRSKIKVLLLVLRIKGVIRLNYEIYAPGKLIGGPKMQVIATLREK